jgi:isoleucyl-tRNA synthetase
MKSVKPEMDFIALETEVLAFWRRSFALERLRELRAGAPLFRFVDGPITANNPMGVHHAWGRTLKDVFLRYKAMRGHRCNYQNGFDCQGLWVEVEVEKALGFNGKPDIERFGIANFSRACRERVETYAAIISKQSARLGQWMDWDHSYYTMADENMTGIWHFLKLCHERGWIYRGSLPMPWCPRCGTSLAEHEMAGSHQQVEHLSVFCRLPLLGDPRRRLLVWTTTPWTLPANTALAVNPRLDYLEVAHPDWNDTLTLAAGTLDVALNGLRVKVVRRFKGEELVGQAYETFFPDLPAQVGIEHIVVAWEEVEETEGSGIVHIAPGCGIEDYALAEEKGLPVLSPVDGAAVYQDGYGWLSGRNAAAVAQDIASHLHAAGKLLRSHRYSHSYPVCWRCKGELIFRLVGEWFIASNEIRPRLIEAARTVEWTPEHIGKRMEDWLNNMGDWCISRKRFWGLTLPFYQCACGTLTVVGSREELRQRAAKPEAVDRLPELHRPWIDEVRLLCPACGSEVERVPEVGDCWLDAGIVPFTTLGYFSDRQAWQQAYPVEWISEMREQVRLWYYSMLFMSVVIAGRAPYEKCLSYERVIAEDGTPFSKSGFMIVFDEAVEQMGADPIRYLFCRQPVGMESRFGPSLAEVARRRLASLWNIYSFFVTYALIDRPSGIQAVPAKGLHVTDRWLLVRSRGFAEQSRAAYDSWDTRGVVLAFEEYVDDLSNWYVRVNRRRFWRQGEPADKRACYAALYTALKTAVQVMAPIIPFVAEEIWQNLVRTIEPDAYESVHHALFAELPAAWQDDALIAATARVRALVSEALRLRKQAEIRVRQPLAVLYVKGSDAALAELRQQEDVVRNELNVVRVAYPETSEELETVRVELDFKAAGPRLRGDVGKVKALLEQLSEADGACITAAAQNGEPLRLAGYDAELPASILHLRRSLRQGFVAGRTADYEIWLDLRIPADLRREGLVRDLIRRIQVARRDADLDIAQRIVLHLETEAPELRAAIEEHADLIRNEVLASRLYTGIDGARDAEVWTVRDLRVRVAFEPVHG